MRWGFDIYSLISQSVFFTLAKVKGFRLVAGIPSISKNIYQNPD